MGGQCEAQNLQYTRFQQLTCVLWTRFQDQMPHSAAPRNPWKAWKTIQGAPIPARDEGAIRAAPRTHGSASAFAPRRTACRRPPSAPGSTNGAGLGALKVGPLHVGGLFNHVRHRAWPLQQAHAGAAGPLPPWEWLARNGVDLLPAVGVSVRQVPKHRCSIGCDICHRHRTSQPVAAC